MERARYAIPELLTLNAKSQPLSLTFLSERHERLVMYWLSLKRKFERYSRKTAVRLNGAVKETMIFGTVRLRAAM